jgi:hypothetical protein
LLQMHATQLDIDICRRVDWPSVQTVVLTKFDLIGLNQQMKKSIYPLWKQT